MENILIVFVGAFIFAVFSPCLTCWLKAHSASSIRDDVQLCFLFAFILRTSVDLSLQLALASALPPNAPRPDPADLFCFRAVFAGLLTATLNRARLGARVEDPYSDSFPFVFCSHVLEPFCFRFLDPKLGRREQVEQFNPNRGTLLARATSISICICICICI